MTVKQLKEGKAAYEEVRQFCAGQNRTPFFEALEKLVKESGYEEGYKFLTEIPGMKNRNFIKKCKVVMKYMEYVHKVN